MSIHQNIRLAREFKGLSQEAMADELNMSCSGYAKIERGATKLHFDKLQKIAQVLNIDVIDLISFNSKGLVIMANDNKADNSSMILSNYYQDGNDKIEIEKLSLIIAHQQELIKQKDSEIETLKQFVGILKKQDSLLDKT